MQLQAAKYGIDCPAHVKVEIDGLSREIEKFKPQLATSSPLSFREGSDFTNNIEKRLDTIEGGLRQVTVKKEIRLFGVPVWSVVTTATISSLIAICMSSFLLSSLSGLPLYGSATKPTDDAVATTLAEIRATQQVASIPTTTSPPTEVPTPLPLAPPPPPPAPTFYDEQQGVMISPEVEGREKPVPDAKTRFFHRYSLRDTE